MSWLCRLCPKKKKQPKSTIKEAASQASVVPHPKKPFIEIPNKGPCDSFEGNFAAVNLSPVKLPAQKSLKEKMIINAKKGGGSSKVLTKIRAKVAAREVNTKEKDFKANSQAYQEVGAEQEPQKNQIEKLDEDEELRDVFEDKPLEKKNFAKPQKVAISQDQDDQRFLKTPDNNLTASPHRPRVTARKTKGGTNYQIQVLGKASELESMSPINSKFKRNSQRPINPPSLKELDEKNSSVEKSYPYNKDYENSAERNHYLNSSPDQKEESPKMNFSLRQEQNQTEFDEELKRANISGEEHSQTDLHEEQEENNKLEKDRNREPETQQTLGVLPAGDRSSPQNAVFFPRHIGLWKGSSTSLRDIEKLFPDSVSKQSSSPRRPAGQGSNLANVSDSRIPDSSQGFISQDESKLDAQKKPTQFMVSTKRITGYRTLKYRDLLGSQSQNPQSVESKPPKSRRRKGGMSLERSRNKSPDRLSGHYLGVDTHSFNSNSQNRTVIISEEDAIQQISPHELSSMDFFIDQPRRRFDRNSSSELVQPANLEERRRKTTNPTHSKNSIREEDDEEDGETEVRGNKDLNTTFTRPEIMLPRRYGKDLGNIKGKRMKIDNYLLLQTIGKGAYGEVFLAIHIETKCKYVDYFYQGGQSDQSREPSVSFELSKHRGCAPF